jgi:hypothetical protein
MSSGEVKNHFQDFPKIDLPLESLFEFDKNNGQKCKFHFLSELISLLFDKKASSDSFKNLSNMIIFTLNSPEETFTNLVFSGNVNQLRNGHEPIMDDTIANKKAQSKEKSLLMLHRIRTIFNKCSELTIKQKSDYCSVERYFMKQFLRDCL